MTIKKKGTRSNRTLTEFACSQLDEFFSRELILDHVSEAGNTSVHCKSDHGFRSFAVKLFNKLILQVVTENDLATRSVFVGFTDFYDGYGQPSTTTMERLNGLLDRLGCHGIIPQGVRVFRDKSQGEHGLTYFGRGDDKIAVGRHYATLIHVTPSQSSLLFSPVCFGGGVFA